MLGFEFRWQARRPEYPDAAHPCSRAERKHHDHGQRRCNLGGGGTHLRPVRDGYCTLLGKKRRRKVGKCVRSDRRRTGRCWGGGLLGQLGDGFPMSEFVPFRSAGSRIPSVSRAGLVTLVRPGRTVGCSAGATTVFGAARQRHDDVLAHSPHRRTNDHQRDRRRAARQDADLVRQLGGLVRVTTGRRHSCALSVSGRVCCWGENTFGRLGINTQTNSNRPRSIPSFTASVNPTAIASGAAANPEWKILRRQTLVTLVTVCPGWPLPSREASSATPDPWETPITTT